MQILGPVITLVLFVLGVNDDVDPFELPIVQLSNEFIEYPIFEQFMPDAKGKAAQIAKFLQCSIQIGNVFLIIGKIFVVPTVPICILKPEIGDRCLVGHVCELRA
jgi:hypothetical protein